MPGKVRVRDRGANALLKRLQEKAELTVGIHEDQGAEVYPDGTTVAEVASFQEFGLGVPRQSFVADTFDESRGDQVRELRRGGQSVVKGKGRSSLKAALERFGERVRDQMRDRAPVDTGTLRDAIEAKVKTKKR